MSEINSTRLRYVRGTLDAITEFIDSQTFKIEFKQMIKEGSKWVLIFVIPDTVKDFKSGDV